MSVYLRHIFATEIPTVFLNTGQLLLMLLIHTSQQIKSLLTFISYALPVVTALSLWSSLPMLNLMSSVFAKIMFSNCPYTFKLVTSHRPIYVVIPLSHALTTQIHVVIQHFHGLWPLRPYYKLSFESILRTTWEQKQMVKMIITCKQWTNKALWKRNYI